MDENAQSFSPSQSPRIYLPKPAGSGLTLVIPSLKSLKASQTSSATKVTKHRPPAHTHPSSIFYDAEPQEKKIPRPVKLKPLKEVLTKLVIQLKKKDDYAFFLYPVNMANVPGYADIVKRPMDLGTMSDKVNRGKYRSLEDFANDFRLVTNNAKMFNPPGTIYYTEADRLEVWGLDHITKAASTVVQYETDWNIEIDDDEAGTALNVDVEDDDGDAPTPMDVDSLSLRERSVSVFSQGQNPIPPGLGPIASGSNSRRGPRGPYRKQGPNASANATTSTLSETLDPDGALPGSKDGLGSFPPGSDWAKTMVALKRKGKRYKTKKERLRFERDGPPLLADGSLDYTEMEDPFSVLSYFVPDPPNRRPQLVPLYPPLSNPPPPPMQPVMHLPTQAQTQTQPQTQYQWLQPQLPPPATPLESSTSQTPQTQIPPAPVPSTYPSATALPPDHPDLELPFLKTLSTKSQPQPPPSQLQSQKQPPKQPPRKHWTIIRSATSSRSKGKEREEDQYSQYLQYQLDANRTGAVDHPAWKTPREPHTLDFGVLGTLEAGVGADIRKKSANVSAPNGTGKQQNIEQDAVLDLIRGSLESEGDGATQVGDGKDAVHVNGNGNAEEGYWTRARAVEAEAYIRDVVYGGVDGFAYVRSLAEFVSGRPQTGEEEDEEEEMEHHIDKQEESEETEERNTRHHAFNPKLGMTLAKWVEQNIVDPLTEGRHSLLRETAAELVRQGGRPAPSPNPESSLAVDPRKGTIPTQVSASLHLYPSVVAALSALMQIKIHKIDMGSLIKTPNELFLSEEEWAGKRIKEKKRRAAEGAGKAETEKNVHGDDPGEDADKMEVEETGASDQMQVEEEEEEEGEEEEQKGDVKVPNGVASANTKSTPNGRQSAYEQEGPEELDEVLQYVADVILEMDRRNRAERAAKLSGASKAEDPMIGLPTITKSASAIAGQPEPGEDPAVRNLRLNLLALAKRAPLDTIARLPKDLVPEHIRHFVPTLGSSG